MGRWDLKIDRRLAFPYWCALIGFVGYCLLSEKFLYIYINPNASNGVAIHLKLFQYLDYYLNFFVCLMTAAIFEETIRKQSISFMRSFPLTIWEFWFRRYFQLLFTVLAILLPAVFVGTAQASDGLSLFTEELSLGMQVDMFSFTMLFARIAISVNFCILLTIVLLIITRNRTLTCTVIFCYYMMELGPIGSSMGQYAWFYGSFGSIPSDLTLFRGREILVLLSAAFELAIPLWFKREFLLE